ncbi:MAG TPA: alpha/beta hydrolase [Chitinophagaceae bacterium]|nr:alpha/beta hydrolase [Chitinophagaceae bacterium]
MKSLFVSVFFIGLFMAARAQTCRTGKLDSRVAQTLNTVLSDLQPASATVSVEQIRDVKMKTLPFPRADVQHVRITADSIPVKIYNPAHAAGLPIIISYHPGGFVTPMLPFMEYEFWRQAKTYRAIVFAVDYRVAPENKYPAAVNDAYNTFKWVADHGQEYGGDTARIIVSGLSAGGNLAAVVCQKAKKEGLTGKIKLQVLNCPSTDHPDHFARYASYQIYAACYFLTKAFCQYYIHAYAPGEPLTNPEIAPIQNKDLAGLPPAVVITAEFDVLRDEGHAYADRLRKAGVPVWYRCFGGQIHCLIGLPDEAKELTEVDTLVLRAMKKVFKKG